MKNRRGIHEYHCFNLNNQHQCFRFNSHQDNLKRYFHSQINKNYQDIIFFKITNLIIPKFLHKLYFDIKYPNKKNFIFESAEYLNILSSK